MRDIPLDSSFSRPFFIFDEKSHGFKSCHDFFLPPPTQSTRTDKPTSCNLTYANLPSGPQPGWDLIGDCLVRRATAHTRTPIPQTGRTSSSIYLGGGKGAARVLCCAGDRRRNVHMQIHRAIRQPGGGSWMVALSSFIPLAARADR